MNPYRGRFAPSPTGMLHMGSLVAAVGSWLRARAHAGAWIVRIEDLDPPREVPGSAREILETLTAFGMRSDEPVVYQSERAPVYRAALDTLRSHGLAYPCWCSRNDLEPFAGVHPPDCIASADSTRDPAWRVRVPDETIEFVDAAEGPQQQNLRSDIGDFVVLRADGWVAYQLAVVVDDAEQAISEVVRGADLLDSTPRQIFLQRALRLPTPAYLHLPLVTGEDGTKLSKQDRARPVDRDNPLPALRHALEFLGFDVSNSASTAGQLLESCVARADDILLHSRNKAS